MIVPPVVVLAGGLGTRIASISTTTPKALLPIAGKAFLEWKILELQKSGVQKIYLLTGFLSSKIKEFVSSKNFDVEIKVIQDEPNTQGTAHALWNALGQIDEQQFVLTYGDNLLPLPISEFTSALAESQCRMVVTSWCGEADNFNVKLKGILVGEYSKKPKESFSHLDFGYTFVSKAAIEPYLATRVNDLGEAFSKLASDGKLQAFETDKRYFEIGTPKTLLETESHLKKLKGTA